MFFSILKNEFISLFTNNQLLDEKKGKIKKPITIFAAALFFIILFGYLSASYSFMLAHSLIPYGAIDLLPLMIYVSGCLVVFFYGALKTNGVLFSFKDFDLLMSMPIPSKTVILAKFAYLYISDLLFALLAMVPALGVWVYYAQPPITSIILLAISLIFVPAIPLTLAIIVGTIVAYISGFSKNKAIINIISNIVLLFAIMAGIMYFTNLAANSQDLTNITAALANQLIAQFPPAKLFNGIIGGDIVAFLLFIAFSALITYAVILIIGSNFIKINSKLASASASKSNKKIEISNQSSFTALLKKEIKMFVSIPVYAINVSVGVIMAVLAGVYLLYLGQDVITGMLEMMDMKSMIICVAPLVLSFMTMMTLSTCSSLSLEGNSLWVIKTLPIKAKDIFLAKIVFNLILIVPVALITGLCYAYTVKVSFGWAIVSILFPLMGGVFTTVAGMILNIKYANFEWTNATKVVKQGMPMLIATFGIMGILAIMFVLVNVLANSITTAFVIYCVAILIFGIASILIYNYICKNAEKIMLSY